MTDFRKDSPQIRRRNSFSTSRLAQHNPSLGGLNRYPVNGEELRDRQSRQGVSSNTWTSSSGDTSVEEGNEDRTLFFQEYNRLANKYGVEVIVPDDFVSTHVDKVTIQAKQGSWIMRKLLRRTSSMHMTTKTERLLRHRRSVSDLSIRLGMKRDTLKEKGLVELVRLCGASALYLPAEYAAGTLAVPTCFRATAQYLVQHAATSRGIFRIPGSHSTVNALYNHYASQDGDGEVINGTVRCPTLPEHINCNVNDVASAFKKFLAGLPGGILGKSWIFECFVSIYNQLDFVAERTRTKQSKVRARLIALAIASVAPRYQRELICAVFGLLSMIGRAAETTKREDEYGRPLPTSDLMGYGALGIVFGPLLIGDFLESHDLRPTGPHGTLIFTQRSPSKGRQKKNKAADDPPTLSQGADKIRIVNSITEMLITHWRDVVRHMKSLGALRTIKSNSSLPRLNGQPVLRPSMSESFAIRRPPNWETEKISPSHIKERNSPKLLSRKIQLDASPGKSCLPYVPPDDMLSIRKRRPRSKPISSQMLSGTKSMSILSPTVEETPFEEPSELLASVVDHTNKVPELCLQNQNGVRTSQSIQNFHLTQSESVGNSHPEEESTTVTKDSANAQRYTRLDDKNVTGGDREQARPTGLILRERSIDGATKHKDMTELETKAMVESAYVASKNPERSNNRGDSFKEYLEMGSSNGGFEYPRTKIEIPSQVPPKISSNRLPGTASTKPDTNLHAGSPDTWKVNHGRIASYQRRTNYRTDSSDTPVSVSKDPLSRIPQEEDIASLKSLAKIIHSEDDTHDLKSPMHDGLLAQKDAPEMAGKTWVTYDSSKRVRSELRSRENSSKTKTKNIFGVKLTATREKTSPAGVPKSPGTPRRSATEMKVQGRITGSSVRALAARFNRADPSLSPSPRTTPSPRHVQRSKVESGVISPYTMNHSPVYKSQRLNRSDQSWRVVQSSFSIERHTPDKMEGRTSALLGKPLFPALPRDNEPRLPLWPKLRHATRSHSSEWLEGKSNQSQIPSDLHRQRDGNASFSISRRPGVGAAALNFNESSATELLHYGGSATAHDKPATPLFKMPRPRLDQVSPIFVKTSSPTYGLRRSRNHSASMLYAQIRHLQIQLQSKTEETEHLKRQLLRQQSPETFFSLGDQLIQVQTELGSWRHRATVAETRLEELFHLALNDRHESNGSDQPLAVGGMADNSRDLLEYKSQSINNIGDTLYEDGAECKYQSSESAGTVRHERPNLMQNITYMDVSTRLEKNLSAGSMLSTSSWRYELE